MKKKYLSRPYMNIQKGTVPTDAYKSGKAVGLLFTLDFLTHQAEGSCVSILDKTENYLKKELKKLGVQIVVRSDGFNISELNKLNVKLEVKTVEVEINSLDDLEINLNMNRGNPMNEGTD